MRPRSLDELVGQEHVLGEGSALRTAIVEGKPHSAILYGPPGSGKTTLARIAAAGAAGAFEEESAVNAGKAEIRGVIERAKERRVGSGRPTVLFLDEIHRFNKAQQDALLPAVEEGLLTLIGATTENPYFEVNSALLSRCQVYELKPLEAEQVEELLRRALEDPERGLAEPPAVEDPALAMLAQRSGGDARVALSALERAVERASDIDPAGEGSKSDAIDVAAIEDAFTCGGGFAVYVANRGSEPVEGAVLRYTKLLRGSQRADAGPAQSREIPLPRVEPGSLERIEVLQPGLYTLELIDTADQGRCEPLDTQTTVDAPFIECA